MSINRVPFNALVDDDGSGTKGTPWNKQAIQDVILDPVDGAIAAALPIVLANHRGVTVFATTENMGVAQVPAGSGEFDTIEVECTFHTFPGAFQPLRLFYGTPDGGAVEIARLDLLGSGLNQILQSVTRIRASASGVASVAALSWGANTTGASPARLVQAAIPGTGNTWATAWTLFLQHPGIPAGDTLLWAWTVTREPRGGAVG